MSRAGLVPAMSLAERAGDSALARRHVTITGKSGVNAEVKISCLVGGWPCTIASILGSACTRIRYPQAIWDGQLQVSVSHAMITEVRYTAFAWAKSWAVTARLIIRRVRIRTARPNRHSYFRPRASFRRIPLA
jgi:hypothetical protein